MPKVPSNILPFQPPAPKVDPTALAMAAAMTVEEGRIAFMDLGAKPSSPKAPTHEELKRLERQMEAMQEVNGPNEAKSPGLTPRQAQDI